MENMEKTGKSGKAVPYLAGAGIVFVMTLFGELLKQKLEPTNIVMFYLLAVVIAAIWWGQGPAILTSILSVLAFDFFLVPPYLTFNVSDLEYVFTFAAFLVVGIVISTLASRTRDHLIRHQKEKLQSALLNSISHDLKTPLSSISGSLSALLDNHAGIVDSVRKELLENALNETKRLSRVVGNLLDMTRTEAGALKINPKACELRDVLGAALEQLKEKIGARSIRIDIPKNFPEVSMDFLFMMKVFYNLIDNALKYSPGDSSIDIKALTDKDMVRIEIKDLGLGIPEQDLNRIFEKFYRVSRPQAFEGTGLGLSICRGIVEAHGGKIWAENNPDKGATFIVTLALV